MRFDCLFCDLFFFFEIYFVGEVRRFGFGGIEETGREGCRAFGN